VTALSDDQLRRLRDLVDAPDLSGTRYRIERRIAVGGMSSVYLAHDQSLDRNVALKILSLPDTSGDFAVRMLREAKIVAQLEHPGIVPIHDVGTLPDGRVYYTMKFVQGQTFDQIVATAANLNDRLRIFLRICEAVGFAHSHGVLHRDLKPSNIMVGPFGETLVMDWGIAAKLREPIHATTDASGSEVHPSSITQDGAIVGTPGYLSPEQASGATELIDHRSDIYGLGALLYYILTGRPPIPDQPVAVAVDRAIRGDIVAPRSVDSTLPRRLEAICLKALSLRPQDRYQSVDLLTRDIGLYLDGEPVSAHVERPWESAARWVNKYQFIVTIALVYIIVRFFFLIWRGL
jgi:serine/threonine protein kinase